MKEFDLRLNPATTRAVAVVGMVLLGLLPIRAQTPSAAVAKIQTYYQQLMPTIQQAARLSVRERDRRFTPVFAAVFDMPTMARLAVGPAWKTFSAEQQAAVRDAFARFIVADYASQIKNYSGESFVVDPQTSPESRGGGEIVKTRLLQPGPDDTRFNDAKAGEIEGFVIAVKVGGDPSAGIQQVWVTYTAINGPFANQWQSLDLQQLRPFTAANPSTLWSGTLPLPSGQASGDVRYIVQAVLEEDANAAEVPVYAEAQRQGAPR